MTENDPLDVPLDLPDTEEPVSKQPSYNLPKPRKSRKKFLIILLFTIIIAITAFGIYKVFLAKDKQQPASQTQPVAKTADQTTTTTSDVPDVAATKEYKNDPLGLTFTYPDSWKITEPETKDGVRIESPTFKYKTINKGIVSGNFRIYMRKGARAEDSTYIGRGVAIADSEKLAYAKPAAGQRTETLLSSFGLDTPDNFAYFFVAGNFNLKKGDTLGPNYGKESETYIISGGYSSPDLKVDLATNTVPTDTYKQTKAYTQAIDILKSIQLQ